MRLAKSTTRTLCAFAALALAAGCGDGTGPNDAVVGDYSLIRVNGGALPVVIVDAIVRDTVTDQDEHLVVEIVEGNLDLDNVGTYGWTVRFDVTVNDELQFDNQPVSVSGRYEINGDNVHLNPTEAGLAESDATLDGSNITFSETHPEYGTFTLTFQKLATDDGDIY